MLYAAKIQLIDTPDRFVEFGTASSDKWPASKHLIEHEHAAGLTQCRSETFKVSSPIEQELTATGDSLLAGAPLDSHDSDVRREGRDMRSTFSKARLREALVGAHLHPDDTALLLRYAPAALTHLCWRNSVIENWHAGPQSRISDADMMRASVATTRIFHQALTDALSPTLAETGPYSADSFDPEDLSQAFYDAFDTAFDPDRVLPHGVSLSALAGDELEELREHASQQLDTLLDVADEEGVHLVLMWLALRGKLAVPNWWGTPNWPFVVDEFFRAFSDPSHEHWHVGGHPGGLPLEAGTPDQLRHRLISAPEDIASDILDFCIHRGMIGFVQVRLVNSGTH